MLHNGNLKEIPWDLRFRRKNHVPIFGSTEKIFFGKVGKNLNIKVEAKFQCGSNARTLSRCKSLQSIVCVGYFENSPKISKSWKLSMRYVFFIFIQKDHFFPKKCFSKKLLVYCCLNLVILVFFKMELCTLRGSGHTNLRSKH